MAAAIASVAPVLIERADIHKSCKSLEGIVSVLAPYTEAANALAIVQKKLVKALKEAASVKGTNIVSANAMMTSAGIFEGLAEVNGKFAKIVDKEVENVQNDLKKWFKKLAKEEKAHDERIANMNAKIKLAGQAYEKKAKRKDRDAVDEHSRYVAILNSVGPEMSKDKYNHTLFVTQRHMTSLSGFAACMSRLAEAEWIRACEDVRKSAPSIGTVGEWRALCEGGWTSPMPGDLPDLGINDSVYPKDSHGAPNAQTPSQPTAASFDMGHLVNTAEAPESPTSSPNLKLPNPIRKLSEDQFGTEQPGTHTTASRSPSPLTTRDPPLRVVQKPSKSEPDPGVQMANEPENTDTNNSSVSVSTRSREMDGTSSKDSSAFTSSATYSTNVELPVMDTQRRAEQPDLNPDHSTKLELGATQQLQSMTSSREYLPNEGVQLDAAKKHHPDLVKEREAEEQYPASLDNTRLPESGRDVIVGGGVTRRLSVESSSSLVAAMRERYDTPPMKPSSPPPRDLPRMSQKVSDLAVRYTPIEPYKSPSRSPGTGAVQSNLSADRFPTFQDKYPRSARDKDRFRALPASPASDRDHFDDRDKVRYRYVETPAMDRNHFSRDERDRSPHHIPMSRSPDRDYFEELGVLGHRQRRIDAMKELSLQEREANLREQEQLLEIERVRLVNAREGGYTSDTGRRHSPYGRPRRSESPSPMSSQQPLHPYDHSPNCGCQRCSAQHYASTTFSHSDRESAMAEQPIVYKPDPPIMLRPEKPKGWLRRMSMPLVPLSDKKSPTVAGASGQLGVHMPLPEDVRLLGRRSFDLDRNREQAARFGGSTR